MEFFKKATTTFVVLTMFVCLLLMGVGFNQKPIEHLKEVYSPIYSELLSGDGSESSPYIITNEDELISAMAGLSGYISLSNNISLTKSWSAYGGSDSPFSAKINGNGYYIDFDAIDTVNSFINYSNGAQITNLTLKNFKSTTANVIAAVVMEADSTTLNNVNVENCYIIGKTIVGGLVGRAINEVQINTASITGYLRSTVSGSSNGLGGIVGRCKKANSLIAQNVTVGTKSGYQTDSTVLEQLVGQDSNLGGLSSAGGEFTNCICYATLKGVKLMGGLVGGYNVTTKFTNTYFAGKLIYSGTQTNNYPYNGIVNGYGAWNYVYNSSSGQLISVKYTSSVDVLEVGCFNASEGFTLSGTSTGGSGEFDIKANIGNSTALSASTLTETAMNGITGNYAGFCVMFKMADGTYKYLFTLDKFSNSFQSQFDINLDNIKSYSDNFNNIVIDTSIGTTTYKTSKVSNQGTVSIWGTALISSGNDLEHLAIRMNGAIPTTIGGKLYNGRSLATLSVKLNNDISLSEHFMGFGMSEMHPYRGSIFGNNKTLNVNMNKTGGYGVGIISFWTEQSKTVGITDLNLTGVISGGARVGIVGVFDGYSRTGKFKFASVTSTINISANIKQAGFVGYGNANNSIKGYFENCINYGSIYAKTCAAAFVGNAKENTGLKVQITNCSNYGTIQGEKSAAFVSDILGVTFVGENSNYGEIQTKQMVSIPSVATNIESVKSYYTVEVVGATDKDSILINSTSFNTDANGKAYINISSSDCFSYVLPTLSYKTAYQNKEIPIVVENDLCSRLNSVIKRVGLCDDNVYINYRGEFEFVTKMEVEYFDGQPNLVLNMDYDAVDSGEVLYKDVVLFHTDYTQTFTVNLVVLDEVVLNYLEAYSLVNNKQSITDKSQNKEFSILAKDLKIKYEQLVNKYFNQSISKTSEEYLIKYITNAEPNLNGVEASFENTLSYLSQIVDNVDVSSLENIRLNYPNIQTYIADVVIIFVNGEQQTKQFNLTTTTVSDLVATMILQNNEIKMADGRVVYILDDNVSATVIPAVLENIEIGSLECFYDGDIKTVNYSVTNLESGLSLLLDYSNSLEVCNVGEYEVSIKAILGENAKFYSIPENYNKGLLKIKPVVYSFTLAENERTEFVVNGISQAPQTNLTKVDGEYVLKSEDYYINYVGLNVEYNDIAKPKTAGLYKAELKLNNTNININSSLFYEFTIHSEQEGDKFYYDLSFVVSDKVYDGNVVDIFVLGNNKQLINELYTVCYYEDGVELNAAPTKAGEYTFKVVPTSPETTTFYNGVGSFVISKKDVSDKIISLVYDELTYCGEAYVPLVNINGSYTYILEFYKNEERVDSIINAGDYQVKVVIVDENLVGSKTFNFKINKASHSVYIQKFNVGSSKIIAPQIKNAMYKLNDGEYQQSNEFFNLSETTNYTLQIKIAETENYLEFVSDSINLTTTLSATSFNKSVSEFGKYSISKIARLKKLMSDYNKICEEEQSLVTSAYYDLIDTHYQHSNSIKNDILTANTVANSSIAYSGIFVVLVCFVDVFKKLLLLLGL